MKMVNIFEAKAQLSELIDLIARGEQVVICKRNQPVAELRPLPVPRATPRPLGLAEGTVSIPSSFFEPLPGDVLDAFERPAEPRADRVAEPRALYGASKSRRSRRSRR